MRLRECIIIKRHVVSCASNFKAVNNPAIACITVYPCSVFSSE